MSIATQKPAPTGINPKFFVPKPVPKTEIPWFSTPDIKTEAIVERVTHLIKTDFRNVLPEGEYPPIWEEPVLGIAPAKDPIFKRFQEPGVVGPCHRLPTDWLPEAQSVISVFLPFSEKVWRSYKVESRYSSFEYASGRYNGAKFLNVVRRNLVRMAEDHGAKAIAPNIDPRYGTEGVLPYWSERHVAFAAGVGTFGLHQNLITARGTYGRICSVVTSLKLTPTERAYTDVYGYCLYAKDGSCRACIDRCPTKAITDEGKVLKSCGQNGNGDYYKAWGYWGCGHCMTFLPCERGIPKGII